MSELGIATAATDSIVLAVISHLNEGNIEDAVALFVDEFSFKDYGIRLEFNTKARLAEFLAKAREFYPNSFSQTETIFVSGSNALTEWTLQATLIEPAFANCRWKVPLSLDGASVVRTENGRITSWSDYYDGLISRRSALASYFTEWIEHKLDSLSYSPAQNSRTWSLKLCSTLEKNPSSEPHRQHK